ncbi:MAG: hypothetical protein WCY49_03370 [Anaerovoracaceae bacterium]
MKSIRSVKALSLFSKTLGFAVLFITTILLFFSLFTSVSYGATELITCQRLDTGVTFLWKNSQGQWQYNLAPNSELTVATGVNIGTDKSNVTVAPYKDTASMGEPGYFDFFGQNNYFNKTPMAWDKSTYDSNYYFYSANIFSVTGESSYNPETGNMTVYTSMALSPIHGNFFNIKEQMMLGEEGKNIILSLLGTPSAEILQLMNLLDPRKETYDERVEGYLLFHPIVITYIEERDAEEIITTAPSIYVEPILNLPPYTYEGHPVTCEDESLFTVDGNSVNRIEIYNSNLADNSFKVLNPNSSSVRRLSNVKASLTFSKRGDYHVQLKIMPKGSEAVSTTESITVHKTPYIQAGISGIKKQYRKQILNIKVATHPGYPVVEYSIRIRDEVTGEEIYLTESSSSPQQEFLKYNPIEVTATELFTTFNLDYTSLLPIFPLNVEVTDENIESLSHNFSCDIFIRDKKGDLDIFHETFTVIPDAPPLPEITMEETFLRDEGTNFARITAEDSSSSKDADILIREWHVDGKPASEITGYESLAFGSDGKIGFLKEGVGPFKVALKVKDSWIEGTFLQEHVVGIKPKEALTQRTCLVDNVAPIVSLFLEKTDNVHLNFLIDAEKEAEITSRKTEWTESLLKENIKADIEVTRLLGGTREELATFSNIFKTLLPYGVEANGTMNEGNLSFSDNERIYVKAFTWPGHEAGFYPEEPVTLLCFEPYEGTLLWQVNVDDFKQGVFTDDKDSNYLYLVEGNRTLVIDKYTGNRQGIIPQSIGTDFRYNFMTERGLFTLKGETLHFIPLSTGMTAYKIDNVQTPSKVKGDLHYFVRGEKAISRGIVNIHTLKTEFHRIKGEEELSGFNSKDYRCLGIDSTGTMVLWKVKGPTQDTFEGLRIVDIDNQIKNEIPLSLVNSNCSYRHQTMALDEEGRCNAVFTAETYQKNSTIYYYMRAINIHTGQTAVREVSKVGQAPVDTLNAVFESQNKVYMVYTGTDVYIKNYGTFFMSAWIFTYNKAATLLGSAGGVGGMDVGEEEGVLRERLAVYIDGCNNPQNSYLRVKAFGIPQSDEQEYVRAYRENVGEDTLVKTSSQLNLQEVRDFLKREDTALKITSLEEVKLTLNTKLLPERTYYYEYDVAKQGEHLREEENGYRISPSFHVLNDSEAFLNETWYVKETYEEDFNDTTINQFFNSSLLLQDGMGGVFKGSGGSSNIWRSYSAPITFTVPEGMKANVSFDFRIRQGAFAWKTGILINGNRFLNNQWTPYGDTIYEGHYNHCELLEEGLNTITCYVLYYGQGSVSHTAAIDNLKVELLERTEKELREHTLKEKLYKRGDITWERVTGFFETPGKTEKYSSMKTTFEEITLTPIVSGTKSTYTLTIPEDYRAVSFCYPKGGVPSQYSGSYDGPTFILSGKTYRMAPSRNYGNNYVISSGQKMYLGLLKGTTTHVADVGYRRTGSIPYFEATYIKDTPLLDTGNYFLSNEEERIYFPQGLYNGDTSLTLTLPKGDHLIQNIKLYYMEEGKKVYVEDFHIKTLHDMAPFETEGNPAMSIVTLTGDKVIEKQEPVPVYKKGEYVHYNIFYSDYENDKSKASYYFYSHTPLNDGLHPDHEVWLTEPIHYFYHDGKYDLTHYQIDNTKNPNYDKESNRITLTFFIEGEQEGPIITFINTEPQKVEHLKPYTINIGIDDKEKDPLWLNMELYHQGVLIFSENRGPIYPKGDTYDIQTYINLPLPKEGYYQVFGTVKDASKASFKKYSFQVDNIIPKIRIHRLY